MQEHKKIKLNIDDGEPRDQLERLEYLGRVHGFYIDVMKQKIESLISEQYEALGMLENTRETDLIIKANINMLNIIDTWFDNCSIEHLAAIKEVKENNPEIET